MKTNLPVGRFASFVLCLVIGLNNPTARAFAQAGDAAATAEELEVDRQHLKQIYKAIQKFKEKNGDLPNWLSDLVPEFIHDTNVLMSPVELRTGRSQLWGYDDPKIRCSYIYEFSKAKAGGIRDQDIPLTMKEWKTRQMEEFGPVIPILRCHLHEQILNLAYSGDVYLTGLFWESDTNTMALMQKLGPGPGATKGRKLVVTVLDPGSKPVSEVEILATNRQSEFGPLPPRKLQTDEEGVCRVNLGGEQPKSVAFHLRKEGYAGVSVHWSDAASIPETWAVTLEKATTIGGTVVGEDGTPIPNVSVGINGYVKDEVGQVVPTRYDTVTSGTDGSWRSAQLPESFDSLSLVLAHPEFMPAEYDLAEQSGAKTVTRENLLQQRAKLIMAPGIEVKGIVAMAGGERVQGAVVQLTMLAEESPAVFKTRTDQMGAFRLVANVTGDAHLVVQATNIAPTFKKLEIAPGFESVVVNADKGQTIKGRIVDENQKPLSGVEISVVAWDGGSLAWRTRSSDDGTFEWTNAPKERVVVSFSKDGYVQSYQEALGGTTEWVVRLEKPFRFTGRVVDDETGEPVRRFTMRRGYSYGRGIGFDEVYRWQEELSHPGDGTFDTAGEEQFGSGMSFKFCVWADGYLPATSPAYEKAGQKEHVFKLKRGQGLAGIVKLPGGEPVPDAKLYLATASAGVYMDKPGEFRSQVTRCQSATSDESGRFQFRPELDQRCIFVAHEKGFAEVRVAADATNAEVTIKPWAIIKGRLTFRNPGPEQSVALHTGNYRYGNEGPFNPFSLYIKVQPDEEGAFVISQAPPGNRRLYVQYKLHDGPGVIPLSHGVFLKLEPGETREINFGGGATLIGKVKVPEDLKDRVDWSRDLHKLTLNITDHAEPSHPSLPANISSEERDAKFKEYSEKQRAYWTSPAGRAREEQARDYLLLFEDTGAFRVEGVAPGKYTLNIAPTEAPENESRVYYGYGRPLGRLVQELEVKQEDCEKSEPIDLGVLELQKADSPVRIRTSSP